MKLIVAQGNPGSEYSHTRHNIGFDLLDSFASKHMAAWSEKPKFNSFIATLSLSNEKALLVKPTTYYNETGLAVRLLADFYKVSSNEIAVLHDDIALPLGTVRTRLQGSDAGNNGIKSLNAHLGTQYNRIRIGIWTERARQMETAAFVLGKFTPEEKLVINQVEETVHTRISSFIQGRFEATSYTAPPNAPTRD